MKKFSKNAYRKLSARIPRYQTLLLRNAPFGQFDQKDIQQILKNEFWYSDDAPRWKNALTGADHHVWWERAVKRLGAPMNRRRVVDGGATLNAIKECSRGQRCKSNACQQCTWAFQKWLVMASAQLHAIKESGFEDRMINYVFPEGQALLGHLRLANFDHLMERCIEAIERAKTVTFGIMAFDISLNDDRQKFAKGALKVPPKVYWQIHIYGFIRTSDYAAVKAELKGLSKGNEKISFPVRSKLLSKTPNKALSYLFKPAAFKRRSYWAVGDKRSSWKTGRDKALSTADHVEYLQAAHQLGIARRIGLVNLHPISKKFRGGKTLSLHPTKPRSRKM